MIEAGYHGYVACSACSTLPLATSTRQASPRRARDCHESRLRTSEPEGHGAQGEAKKCDASRSGLLYRASGQDKVPEGSDGAI